MWSHFPFSESSCLHHSCFLLLPLLLVLVVLVLVVLVLVALVVIFLDIFSSFTGQSAPRRRGSHLTELASNLLPLLLTFLKLDFFQWMLISVLIGCFSYYFAPSLFHNLFFILIYCPQSITKGYTSGIKYPNLLEKVRPWNPIHHLGKFNDVTPFHSHPSQCSPIITYPIGAPATRPAIDLQHLQHL